MSNVSRLEALGINLRGHTYGQIKTLCPKCSAKRHNKSDRCLSVNIDNGVYSCHHCEYEGGVSNRIEKIYPKPEWKNNTELPENVVKWFERRGISQKVINDMKISYGLEWMPQEQREVQTIQFNYFLDGELINIKYRTAKKGFKLFKDAELIPYNIDSILGKTTCIICEGEIDCLTYIQCGYDSVISVPNGAGKNLDYLDRFIESHFDDKETIYLATDTDTKGLELRAELVRRLGADKCKIITYGEDCKDANDLMQKIGGGFIAVRESIENAKDVRVDGVFEVKDLDDELFSLWKEGLKRGAIIGHNEFDNFVSWVTGRLCVITGIPSSGKSEFLDEIVVNLNLRQGWKVGYFSPENHPIQWHIAKLMSRVSGKKFDRESITMSEYDQTKEYIDDNFFFISPEDDSDIDNILEKARWLVKRRGIKILVIDPYNKLEHNMENGMSETQYISKFLDRLIMFAKKNDLLLFLVAHPTKMKKEDGRFEVPTLYSISGSAHFYNKADYGISVYRDFNQNIVEAHIQKVKYKHLGGNGVAYFKYNMDNGRYLEYVEGAFINYDSTNLLVKKEINKWGESEQGDGNYISANINFDDDDLPPD